MRESCRNRGGYLDDNFCFDNYKQIRAVDLAKLLDVTLIIVIHPTGMTETRGTWLHACGEDMQLCYKSWEEMAGKPSVVYKTKIEFESNPYMQRVDTNEGTQWTHRTHIRLNGSVLIVLEDIEWNEPNEVFHAQMLNEMRTWITDNPTYVGIHNKRGASKVDQSAVTMMRYLGILPITPHASDLFIATLKTIGGATHTLYKPDPSKIAHFMSTCCQINAAKTARALEVSTDDPSGVLVFDSATNRYVAWSEYDPENENLFVGRFGDKDPRGKTRLIESWQLLLELLWRTVLKPAVQVRAAEGVIRFGAEEEPKWMWMLNSWPQLPPATLKQTSLGLLHVSKDDFEKMQRPIHIHGRDFPTVEHYIQWMTVCGGERGDHILTLSADEAVEYVESLVDHSSIEPQTDLNLKDRVKFARTALVVKFYDNGIMQKLLQHETKGKMVRFTTRNHAWAFNPTRLSSNVLGNLLMRTRAFLPCIEPFAALAWKGGMSGRKWRENEIRGVPAHAREESDSVMPQALDVELFPASVAAYNQPTPMEEEEEESSEDGEAAFAEQNYFRASRLYKNDIGRKVWVSMDVPRPPGLAEYVHPDQYVVCADARFDLWLQSQPVKHAGWNPISAAIKMDGPAGSDVEFVDAHGTLTSEFPA